MESNCPLLTAPKVRENRITGVATGRENTLRAVSDRLHLRRRRASRGRPKFPAFSLLLRELKKAPRRLLPVCFTDGEGLRGASHEIPPGSLLSHCLSGGEGVRGAVPNSLLIPCLLGNVTTPEKGAPPPQTACF